MNPARLNRTYGLEYHRALNPSGKPGRMIDAEAGPYLRAVLVGMLRETDR